MRLALCALLAYGQFFIGLFVFYPGGLEDYLEGTCLNGPSMCSCACALNYEYHRKFCNALLEPVSTGGYAVTLGGEGEAVAPSSFANFSGLATWVADVEGNASSTPSSEVYRCIPLPPPESAEWGSF